MKPDSIYYFSRVPGCKTRYMQIKHKGNIVPDFPSIYKSGKYKGEKYVVFRMTSDYYNQSHIRFTHVLELAGSQIITKLIFLPEYPRQSYGAFREYGMLIEFSKDFNQLAIWFFNGLQAAAPILFQKKQTGGIPEITKSEVVRIKHDADSSYL